MTLLKISIYTYEARFHKIKTCRVDAIFEVLAQLEPSSTTVSTSTARIANSDRLKISKALNYNETSHSMR
jgi:hypothetical protein